MAADSDKLNLFQNELKIIIELVYEKCGFVLTNLMQNLEGKKYGASSFLLNNQIVEHRFSKITPTKSGQFVTIWKRNKEGITEPFDVSDNLDFIIITTRSGSDLGQFIFPKQVLASHGVISKDNKKGKRGLRVYPPWEIAPNKQALLTQSWQIKYFVNLLNDNSINLDLVKKLLANKI
jgi:hypothetical protein